MHTPQILSVEYTLIYFHVYIEVHQSGAKVNRDKRAIACFACKKDIKVSAEKDNGLLRLRRMSISAGAVHATVDMGAMNPGQFTSQLRTESHLL
jgi:hypothetical protein